MQSQVKAHIFGIWQYTFYNMFESVPWLIHNEAPTSTYCTVHNGAHISTYCTVHNGAHVSTYCINIMIVIAVVPDTQHLKVAAKGSPGHPSLQGLFCSPH